MPQPSRFSDQNEEPVQESEGSAARQAPDIRRSPATRLYPWLVVAAFIAGLSTSYLAWRPAAQAAYARAETRSGSTSTTVPAARVDLAALEKEVTPPGGYELPARYGTLGPRLIQSGAIDYDAFVALYEQAGTPLSAEQLAALKDGADEPIVITTENAHFLLNLFWAVGLASKNPILTNGPLLANSGGHIERFASTGGWTLSSKPVTQLFASVDLIPLSQEQQQRVEEVAAGVYRPCCGNATLFPDCNHGMAMLGLLELMASQDASVDQMFTAAKYINAFWFPGQTLETAIYMKSTRGLEFAQADARLVTGGDFASGSGSQQVHDYLEASGLLPKAPDNGGSCGT